MMKTSLPAAVVVSLFLAACGGSAPASPVAPAITLQPSDTTVAPGQTTTFSVQVADGGLPVTYQWSWNGLDVDGATSATLTTRAAEVADNGTFFSVIVKNSVGTTTSRTAMLTVSPAPRAPRVGDLRFHGVGAAPIRAPYVRTVLRCGSGVGYDKGVVGSPLQIMTGAPYLAPCGAWFYAAYLTPPTTPPSTFWAFALPDVSTLEATIANLGSVGNLPPATAGSVITSLDVVDDKDQYAMTLATPVTPGFRQFVHSVAPGDVTGLATAEGAVGRVITGIAFHAGSVLAVSYGWDGDPGVKYETSVVSVTYSSLPEAASSLSAAGYILTASGSNGAGGVILVGTKVEGDTEGRPIAIVRDAYPPPELVWRGYVAVGGYFDNDTLTWSLIMQQ